MELEVTKQGAKGTKTANTEAIKLSEATTMATANSSVEDGAATTDSNINKTWMATFVVAAYAEARSLVDCCLMDHLWGCNFSTKSLCYYYSKSNLLFSSLRLRWIGKNG